MQYYTRFQESPSSATLAMLLVNPTTIVEVVPMEDRYGRTVTVRTVGRAGSDRDSVYVCAGNNAIFVANVIALAHAHNVAVGTKLSQDLSDAA